LQPLVETVVPRGSRRYFRELQAGSEEGIASNILADRLKRLAKSGLLTRKDTRPPSGHATAWPNPRSNSYPCSRSSARISSSPSPRAPVR